MADERLSTSGYTPPGTYIGEATNVGGTNAVADIHVLGIVGRGSRYINVKNQAFKRGYIYSQPVSFSTSSPHSALLPSIASGKTADAIVVDSSGTEIRKDFWKFSDDKRSIVISDQIFNPAESYYISYQSADVEVGDPIATDDIRTIEAVGSQIDQDSYKRNVDFFIDTAVLPPQAALDSEGNVVQQTNPTAEFSDVTKIGTGTGVVSLSNSAIYTHLYSRSYQLEVVSVVGNNVTFEWKSTPISFGNNAAPSTPLVPGLASPSFVIDTTKPQTLTADLEFGVRVDFSAGTYVIGDIYDFVVYGPELLEVDSALGNSNQFASASTVIPSAENLASGSLVVDAEEYALDSNVNVVVEVVDVDAGVVVATVPSGAVDFQDSNPVDGATLTISNGVSGAGLVQKTFEFDSNNVVVAGNTKVALSTIAAVAATGSLTFLGAVTDTPADGDTVQISDGLRTVVFEFDSNNSIVNPGAVRVIIDTTPGSQSAKTAENLVTAINLSALNINAVDASVGNGNVGKVTLTNSVAGTVGNNGIVSSTSFISVIGMTGGENVKPNVSATAANLVAEINDSNPRLGVVAFIDENNAKRVRLVHGAQFVFTANPAPADTITVNVGGVSSTYNFVASAPGTNDILIGVSLAATLANIVAKINSNFVIAVSSQAGGLNTVTIASKIARNVVLTESSTVVTAVVSVIDNSNALSNGNVAIATSGTGFTVSGLAGGVDAQDSPDIVTFAYGISGDIFASGVFSIAEGYNENKEVALFAGSKLKLSKAIASKAEGSITLNAVPANNDTVVINDGVAPVTLTFKTVATLPTDVAIVAGDISSTTTNLLNKVASQALLVTGSKIGSNTVKLVHKRTGASYNNNITFTGTALSVVGFAGGASNYSEGDKFAFSLLAPRKFSTALDNRKVTLTVSTVGIDTQELTDPGQVIFSYSSDTPEGGFGEVVSQSSSKGYFTLPGLIRLTARNTHGAISTAINNKNRFAVGDRFQVEYINNGYVYWTLNKKATESRDSSDVFLDRNGTVTGKAATYYVVLNNKPFSGTIKVLNAGVSFSGWSLVAGTNVLALTVKKASEISDMKISYIHSGSEPALGSNYYMTANYLRPVSFYNNPRVFFKREDALDFVSPITADNDLAIGINIAYDQEIKPKAIAILQVRDSDDDGSFSPADIDTVLSHAAGVTYITELIPLRLSNYLDKFLAFNVQGNDPFAKREHIFGYGAPIGTPIGSELDEGSLIFTARRTLQVYGKSPAHGRRFMVASTRGRKKTTLTDGTVINPVLDGSFFALAVAAKISGQNTNDSTILNTNILGFNDVEVFNEPANLLLGGASLIYFEDLGSNVYQIKEDVTVDDTQPHHHEILAVRTKIDATRIVRRELDKRVIGMVPPTKAAGIDTIKGEIMEILRGLVANGTTAPYQDESGNARPISPDDVTVIRDENDPSLFHFKYVIYTKSAVKRMFGVYSVNENVFTPQV